MRNLILPLVLVTLSLLSPHLHAKQMDCIVTVVDTQGRPIRGAEVSVWGHNFDSGVYSSVVEQLFGSTETSDEGEVCVRFEYDTTENNLFVFAQKRGFAVGWNSVHTSARIPKIRIVLDRIHSTAGIVTDEENRPIAGAKVTAYPVDEMLADGTHKALMWPDSTLLTTKTDHEGRFSFNCFAEWMEVSFSVEYPGRAYTHTSFGLQGEHLKNFKTGTKDIHITMRPAGQIKGRILAKRGNKIEGVRLLARGEGLRGVGARFESVSDADGRFTFDDLPPDVYLVTKIADGGDSAQQITTGAIAEVEVGKTVENVRIRMRDPIQLDVLVKDAKTNQPISNARVSVLQKRASKIVPHLDFRTTTDNRGIARVITLSGKCDMGASCDQYDGAWGQYLVRSTDTNFMIGLNPYTTVTGQVVYEDGRGAAGVEVAASTFKTERKLTDRNGRFRIVHSEKSAQRGFIIARDVKTGLAGLVDITEHEGPVKVVLKPAATLKGRVIDPDGQPIPRARVGVLNNIPYYMTCFGNNLYTNEEGQFELSAVPYEQKNFAYRVSALAYGYSEVYFEKIDVKEDMGDIVELPPLVLKPRNMAISGRGVYEDGTVAAYKQVYLGDIQNMNGQPELSSVTDADGRFHFDGACEGWAKIQCGSVLQNDYGYSYLKGGDTVTIVFNNSSQSQQLHVSDESPQGKKLPMYEKATKGLDSEKLDNKKLLICFWESHEEKSQAVIKELAEIAEQLDNAGISVILLNGGRAYSGEYANFNIGNDKKWLTKNKVSFQPVYLEKTGDLLELRRAVGARFLSHMVLTDENKIVTNEGFDIQWLKEHILVKEEL